MIIQCTKKLLDQLKIKPATTIDDLPLFSWHANLITVNHRKTIVLVNDSNRYIIVLYGLKAKDFKNLDNIITNSIRETLLDECIKNEIVEQFIIHSPRITYAKTKDRTLVARMNKACDNVYFYGDVLNLETINQSAVSMKSSSLMVGDGNKSYIHPNEVMYMECLAGEGNNPPEDVGGEGGYDEYINAISDPQHPEHKSMIDWAEGQYYKDFEIELVNRRLKNMTR